MKKRISKKLTAFFFFLVISMPYLIIPVVQAQEVIVSLSEAEGEFTTGFFNIKKTSFAFNDIGIDETDLLIKNNSLPFLPLVAQASDPYNVTTINQGAVQQSINGELFTIYQWEIWYYYDIALYTSGDSRIIQGVPAPKHVGLFHSGWGFNPGKFGHEDGITHPFTGQFVTWASLGYETADVPGTTQHVEIFFENYDIPLDWKQQVENWAWSGAFSYEIELDPRYVFPANVSVEDGTWTFDDFYAGFITTQMLQAERGLADQFNVFVDQQLNEPASNGVTPGEQGQLLNDPNTGFQFTDSVDAYYIEFRDDQTENSQAKANAPPNGTSALMTAVATNDTIVEPPPFNPTALQILNQQRNVKVKLTGFLIRPEVWVVAGTHYYHKYGHYEGLIGTIDFAKFLLGPLGLFIPGPSGAGQFASTSVNLDWFVKNSYIVMSMRTGVRVATLYKWEDNPLENLTGIGIPLSMPNFFSTDLIISAGIQGGLSGEVATGMLEAYWWLFLIIGVVVAVWAYGKFRQGREARTVTGVHTGTAALLRGTIRGILMAVVAAAIFFIVGLFYDIPLWIPILTFALIGVVIVLYGYSWWRSHR